MKEKEKNYEKFILSGALILLLIVSVVGITYAVFSYQREGEKNNVITTGSIIFTYTETTNGINLQNAMPISDEVGKKLERSENNEGYFDFNVLCSLAGTARINYEVYATKLNVENPLSEEYVKMYLTDGTTDQPILGYDNDVPTYYSLKDSTVASGSKTLYTGSFTNSGVQSFRLRMWLSDQYTVTDQSNDFKIKVNIKADTQ